MFTVSQLARKYHVSRTAILYYERAGLLDPACRSSNGYRWYGEKESDRLEAILSYRSFGLPISGIAPLLDHDDDAAHDRILRRQFTSLEQAIRKLRRQQEAIVALLEQPLLLEQDMIDKKRWTEIMKAAGLDEQDMKNWHHQFEKMEPEAHQEFLESLGIDTEEIGKIRDWSRG
jgi:DNA-binding transcriptional MerR regulator